LVSYHYTTRRRSTDDLDLKRTVNLRIPERWEILDQLRNSQGLCSTELIKHMSPRIYMKRNFYMNFQDICYL